MKTKILILLLLSTLMLNACFGSDEDTNSTVNMSNKNLYETSTFSMAIPYDWEVIDKEKFTSDIPQDIVVAFRNNIKNEEFTTNLTVSLNLLEGNINSEDYGKSSVIKASNRLISFRDRDSEKIDIILADKILKGYLVTYEGKKRPDDPIIIFKQLFVVDNGNAYTVTSAYLPSEDESVVNLVDEMLKSFTLK